MKTTEILMSLGNPTGHKLEELLATIKSDLEFKQTQFRHNASETNQRIARNNNAIIDALQHMVEVQNNTMSSIDENFVGEELKPGFYVDQDTGEHLPFPIAVDKTGIEEYPEGESDSELSAEDARVTPENVTVDKNEG